MKKRLIMGIIVLGLLLSACSQGNEGETGNASGTNDTSHSETTTETAAEPVVNDDGEQVVITILQNESSISETLEEAAAIYEAETGIKIVAETLNSDYFSVLMGRFQTEAPDIFTNYGGTDATKMIDQLEDLSGEPWVEYAIDGTLDAITIDGSVYGQPYNIQGMGFIYNKDMFEQVGITTPPTTYAELEAACVALDAAGIRPFVNAYAEFWVLANQNLSILMGQQEDPEALINGLMAGEKHFADTPNLDGYMRLFDLTIQYGQDNMTTAGDYSSAVTEFAAEQAAMIQMGTWAQGTIDEINPGMNVGYLPMPITDGVEEKLCGGVPMYWAVYNGSEVKEEAKAFLNWLVTTEVGNDVMTETLNYMPAFTNVEVESLNSLNEALFEYTSADQFFSWIPHLVPGDGNAMIADAMKEYINGNLTREEFYAEVDNAYQAAQ